MLGANILPHPRVICIFPVHKHEQPPLPSPWSLLSPFLLLTALRTQLDCVCNFYNVTVVSMELDCQITEHWVCSLWIWKNQRGRNFLNCNREGEDSFQTCIYRKEENCREQERKLRKGMVGNKRGPFKDYKILFLNAEGICKKIGSKGSGFEGK